MAKDFDKCPRSRKWLLTINNPVEKGFTHERIREELAKLKSVVYWCMSDETGAEGTHHTHIYLAAANAIRATTIGNSFTGAHRDIANGTSRDNRDYVFKEGKWKDTEKGTTNHRDTHEEWGEMPIERQGARNDIADLYAMIKDGLSTFEILESNPQYLLQLDRIEKARQILADERFKDTWRSLETAYIWGATGTGKTRSIMEKYGYSNVFRVTDYEHPFDGYKGQDVVLFDEFHSSIPINAMLEYLDGYPVELCARYVNKHAAYSKVYIISNMDLRNQYRFIQQDSPETWQAFLRRIHSVQVYTEHEVVTLGTLAYLEGFHPCFSSPFAPGANSKN